jgi:hypothetical protein
MPTHSTSALQRLGDCSAPWLFLFLLVSAAPGMILLAFGRCPWFGRRWVPEPIARMLGGWLMLQAPLAIVSAFIAGTLLATVSLRRGGHYERPLTDGINLGVVLVALAGWPVALLVAGLTARRKEG